MPLGTGLHNSPEKRCRRTRGSACPLVPSHDSSAIRRIVNYVSWAVSATVFGFRARCVARTSPSSTPHLPPRRCQRCSGEGRQDAVCPPGRGHLAGLGLRHGLPAPGSRSARSWGSVPVFCTRLQFGGPLRVISPGAIDLLKSRDVPGDKLSLVYNWTDEPDSRHVDGRAARQELGLPENAFVILDAGNHGPAQGLDVVIKAAHEVRDLHDVQVLLVGDGLRAATQTFVAQLDCRTSSSWPARCRTTPCR